MRVVLGLDGGGSKTDCVLMEETGAIHSRSRSGASNPRIWPLPRPVAEAAVLLARDALTGPLVLGES